MSLVYYNHNFNGIFGVVLIYAILVRLRNISTWKCQCLLVPIYITMPLDIVDFSVIHVPQCARVVPGIYTVNLDVIPLVSSNSSPMHLGVATSASVEKSTWQQSRCWWKRVHTFSSLSSAHVASCTSVYNCINDWLFITSTWPNFTLTASAELPEGCAWINDGLFVTQA